jgi:hypothetical protein
MPLLCAAWTPITFPANGALDVLSKNVATMLMQLESHMGTLKFGLLHDWLQIHTQYKKISDTMEVVSVFMLIKGV